MTSTVPDESTDVSTAHRGDSGAGPIDSAIDWLVALALALGGLIAGAAGVALYWVADPALSERVVAEMTVESTFLSTATTEEAITALMVWGGAGLALTGVLSLAGGIAYLAYRRRLRRRDGVDASVADTPTAAVIGGVLTAFASFVPFSPVLGGGLAGYLRSESKTGAAGAGALAGVVTSAPLVVVGAALVAGAATADAAPIAAIVAIALAFSLVVTVALSALGGLLGAVVADRDL